MNVVFFNYLPLEYGGGTAKYFIHTSLGLHRRYKTLQIRIVTLDNRLAKILLRLYSIYFLHFRIPPKTETFKDIHNQLGNISYKQCHSFKQLRLELAKADVVYSKNDILEACILQYVVGYSHLKKVVFGFHTPFYYKFTTRWPAKIHNLLYTSFFYRHLLSHAHSLHVISKSDFQKLHQIFPQKHIKQIFIPFFKQTKYVSPSERNGKYFSVLWVGRFTSQKGIEDLINIIEQIEKSNHKSNIDWIIAGEGEKKDSIIRLATQYKNVTYVGYMPNNQIHQLMQKTNIFVSTSHWESFPYAILEAQFSGLPVIGYNIPGTSDIIEDRKSGYLVKTKDEFIKKILFLQQKNIFHPEDIRKYIQKKINNDIIFRQMFELLIYDKN